jgi:DNA polymerase delta subunit 2
LKINDYLDVLEITLNKLTHTIDVDIMPGEFDISSAVMPQQPLNKAMFPNLIYPDRVNFVTNPHQFVINGIKFLGTAGQNIKDVRMYADKHIYPIDIMQTNLEINHICPTTPDTLRCYSFTENDPFIVSDAPHVYFCGNQPIYQ